MENLEVILGKKCNEQLVLTKKNKEDPNINHVKAIAV
jgi:hypothetical protein